MGYTGPDLARLFPQVLTDKASRRMAVHGRDELHRLAVANTPIDDNPYRSRKKPPRGETRRRWRAETVHKVVAPGSSIFEGTPVYAFEGRVVNNVDWIEALESGSGLQGPRHAKYPIRPKQPGGMLRWRDRKTGQWRTAKLVMHPGIHGQHMMFYASQLTEHTAAALLEHEVFVWAAEQESWLRQFGRTPL